MRKITIRPIRYVHTDEPTLTIENLSFFLNCGDDGTPMELMCIVSLGLINQNLDTNKETAGIYDFGLLIRA